MPIMLVGTSTWPMIQWQVALKSLADHVMLGNLLSVSKSADNVNKLIIEQYTSLRVHFSCR